MTQSDFYNLLNQGVIRPFIFDVEYLLIVDMRSLEAYRRLHVTTSLHHSM